MKPTEILKEEHVAIKSMLEVRICDRPEVGPDHLERVVEFADKAIMEDMLFPAMAEVGIPVEGGPIGVMLAEHETGRSKDDGGDKGIQGRGRCVEVHRKCEGVCRAAKGPHRQGG